ncbi:MAG: beta-ketoacyl-ACP synthase II [Planctomycetaceae bacterium]|nr:beta-ketoacyl-ACP synthase II [Planctomycetaceae bacterium]
MPERIVVTGLGVVSPVGIGMTEFWAAIRNGKSGIDRITRFDASRVACQIAAEVKNFDAKEYFDPKLSQRTALFTQFAMFAAREAWEMAELKWDAVTTPDRVGVILGNGIGGLEVDNEAQRKLFDKGPSRIPAMTIPRMIGNEAAGNVSMLLGIHGISHTVVTACASGTDAIGNAMYYLRAGLADVVIAGGTESAITEYGIGGFCALKALSTAFNDDPPQASRPFDKKRDGFVMGEGAGVLILETLSHAQKRDANIIAEIVGYAGTSDAYHLTAPHPDGTGAANAIRLALAMGNLKPEDIDYVNAHGTSTPTNDPVETKAIKQAFGEHAYQLKVSSTKGVMGHCIGAAGALEALVCVKAIEDNFFPATANLDEPDAECDLDYVPKVGQTGNIRTAVSTSLGFGGHNSAVVVKRFE